METNPLVTVNILSFNRKDELRNTLTKVYEQDYKNIEVIVVDNASSDGSSEMVKNEFPSVQLIQMGKNIGIAGWNEGFKIAKGEYVLVLDDDSYPQDRTLIGRSLGFFCEKNVGLLAYRIWNSYSHSFENDKFDYKNSPDFIGCGALIRMSVLSLVGLFNERLFIYLHETDFTIKLYNYNYKIVFSENHVIVHNSSSLNRSNDRKKFFFTRNYLIVIFSHFSFNKVIFRIIRIMVGRIFSGIKQGGFISILKGILSFIKEIHSLIPLRKPVRNQIQKLFGYGNFAGGYHFRENGWEN